MRNSLEHVPADDEIELAVRQAEIEDAAVLEADAIAEPCASALGGVEVGVDDVHAQHAGQRKHLADANEISPVPQPASSTFASRGKSIAREERLFLRPDRLGLRRKIADHRLVRHFTCLWIQLVHFRSL